MTGLHVQSRCGTVPVMTDDEARKLSTRVAKESHGVTVKFGRTNGRRCLHLIVNRPDQGLAYSETIYSTAEWDQHEENVANRPSRREQREAAEGIKEAVANKEAQ